MSLNDRFLNDYAAGSAGADFAAQRRGISYIQGYKNFPIEIQRLHEYVEGENH